MSAPERIWADLNMGIWLGAPQPDRRPSPPPEYVRADLLAALSSKLEEVTQELERRNFIQLMSVPTAQDKAEIWHAQAEQFAVKLDAAEAELKRMRKALKPLIANSELVVRMLVCQSIMLGMGDTETSPLIIEVKADIARARAALAGGSERYDTPTGQEDGT